MKFVWVARNEETNDIGSGRSGYENDVQYREKLTIDSK